MGQHAFSSISVLSPHVSPCSPRPPTSSTSINLSWQDGLPGPFLHEVPLNEGRDGDIFFPLLSSLSLPLWAFGGWRGRITPPPLPRPTFGATGSLSYFFSLCMILIPQILQTLKQFAIFLGRFQDIVLRLEKLKVLHETYWSPHEIPFVLWKHSRSSLTFSKFWGLSFLQCYAVSSGMHIFKNVAHIVYDRRKCKMKRVSVRFVCNEGMLPDPLEISLEWG